MSTVTIALLVGSIRPQLAQFPTPSVGESIPAASPAVLSARSVSRENPARDELKLLLPRIASININDRPAGQSGGLLTSQWCMARPDKLWLFDVTCDMGYARVDLGLEHQATLPRNATVPRHASRCRLCTYMSIFRTCT